MFTLLTDYTVRAAVHERQQQAEAANRARRLVIARRLARKAEVAQDKARLAQLALG